MSLDVNWRVVADCLHLVEFARVVNSSMRSCNVESLASAMLQFSWSRCSHASTTAIRRTLSIVTWNLRTSSWSRTRSSTKSRSLTSVLHSFMTRTVTSMRSSVLLTILRPKSSTRHTTRSATSGHLVSSPTFSSLACLLSMVSLTKRSWSACAKANSLSKIASGRLSPRTQRALSVLSSPTTVTRDLLLISAFNTLGSLSSPLFK